MVARAGGQRGGPGGPGGRGGPGDRRLQPGAMAALRRALRYLRGYWRDSAGALVALILVSVTNLAAPQLIRLAIDTGVAGRQTNAIIMAVVGLVLVAALRGLFSFAQGYLAERASQGVAYELRDALFAKLQRLSFSYYDGQQTGQLLTRLTSDVEQIRTFAGTGLIQIMSAAFMLLGTAILLFTINWRLAIVALLIIPPILLVLSRFTTRIGPLFGMVQMQLSRLNTILQEDLSGVRVIRAFAREDYETARYREANDALFGRNLQTVQGLLGDVPVRLLLRQSRHARGDLGRRAGSDRQYADDRRADRLQQLSGAPDLPAPLARLPLQHGPARGGVLPPHLRDSGRPDRRDRPTGRGPAAGDRAGWSSSGAVGFRYPGSEREILHDVSFVAEPGQTVAILGTTGSGKSTIVNLLPRFYDVSAGAVLIDGYDVRDVTLNSLRSQIGIVLARDACLFSGTVRDNIAYGRPDGDAGGGRGGGARGPGRRVHPRAAAGLRHDRRGAGRRPVRRAAPADRDRPRPARRAAPDHPR